MSQATMTKPIDPAQLKPEPAQQPALSLSLVSLEAVQMAADRWAEANPFPRPVGRNWDITKTVTIHTKDGARDIETPMMVAEVGKLIVLQKQVNWLNEQLLGLLQERFNATANAMASSMNENSGGVVDERYRTVLPFNGPLKVDRIDAMGNHPQQGQ